MTLYEYKMLSADEQYDIIFSKGKFLDIYVDGNAKYVLYLIDAFFVRVDPPLLLRSRRIRTGAENYIINDFLTVNAL